MPDHKTFENPPCEFRSAPFWSWNDDLQPDELVRQVRAFREQGIGGFFMHSRPGLLTPYMSEVWMRCVEACVDEARRSGMKSWLYDEDRWPSGSCGGEVTRNKPDLSACALRLQIVPAASFKRPEQTVAIFSVKRRGNQVVECRDVSCKDLDSLRAMGGELAGLEVVRGVNLPWYNDSAYIDTRNPRAVDAFLASTHEPYRERFGKDFAGPVPGVFTDEPHGNPASCPGPGIPWTDGFAEYFEARHTYDVRPQLLSLFFDVGDYRRVRFDFWSDMSRLFADVFCKRVGEWCERHKIALTGHVWEHTFPSPMQTGSTMPAYEYMQTPGIDLLFNQYELPAHWGSMQRQFGSVMIVKEVASVAHQVGRERVLSETYGGAGWELSFEDQKRIGDWEFALGINFLCQHLSLYSLRGVRKRDYPPSFMPHQPWWPCYHLLGDYFARLSYALSRGEFVANLLVLHPYPTAWTNFAVLKPSPANAELDRAFSTLNKHLCEMHRDFDLGDDILMEKHGVVEGNRLRIGRMSYEVVIIPPCTTLRDSNVELLRKFVSGGGKLIAIHPVPSLVNGVESAELAQLFKSPSARVISDSRAALQTALKAACPPDVTVTDAEGNDIHAIYFQHRREGDNVHIYFFSSLDKQRAYAANVTLAAAGCAEEWDLATGERRPIAYEKDGDRLRLTLDFAPVGSRLIVVGPNAKPPARPKRRVVKEAYSLGGPQIARTALNALTLDFVQYKIQDGAWSPRIYVRKAHREIREFYRLSADDYRCTQFWLAYRKKRDLGPQARLALKYDFHVDEPLAPGKQLYLIIETPERFTITVNGQVVPSHDEGWWIDPAFRKINIAALAVRGRNEIVLECAKFEEDVEIEACYLAGDFQARAAGNRCAIAPETDPLPRGDWTAQGYPFYAGGFAYSYQFTAPGFAVKEKYFLSLDSWEGTAVRVLVNGRAVGALGWRPYELDVTHHLVAGANTITVEVLNSLRNLLGPHHASGVAPGLVGPGHFTPADANWTDSYHTLPCGLTGDVKILRVAYE